MISGEFRYSQDKFESQPGYREAITREKVFALWLADNLPHHDVAYSSKDQNVLQDIDVTIDTLRTISFKYCPKCKQTGNLAFELEVYSNTRRDWVKGWYHSGRADYYVFEAAQEYWLIDKLDIQQFVRDYGWDRISSLGHNKRSSQAAERHDHRDSKTGLLKLDKLIKQGIAKKLTPNEDKLEKQLYIRKYRKHD